MASLAFCLKRFNVSQAETDFLRERVDQLVKEKMSQAEAEVTAARQWIKELEDDRLMITMQIKTLADKARERHRDPWFSFDFAVKNAPKLRDRISNLAQMFTDSNAFANGDIYDGSYPIPKRGGILAAKNAKRYSEDEAYKKQVDTVIEEIKSHLRDTIYMYQIVTSQARTGSLGVEYAIIEDPTLPMGEPKVTVTQAWHAASKDMYGSYMDLGGIAVREGLQNSIDAVTKAQALGQIKKGKIDINVFKEGTPVKKPSEFYYYQGDAYEVIDNGVGMDADTIDTKFMALYETGKNDEESIGGKGVACAVILGPCKSANWVLESQGFYHSSERIDKKQNIARVDKPRQGTRLFVESKDGERFVKGDAIQYIETSEFPSSVSVTLNGQKAVNPFAKKQYKLHPFVLNENETETIKVGGVEKTISARTDYEIKYYRIPPKGYENKTVIRMVNEKTGVKLTQAIINAGGSDFKGAIVMDITTKVPPRSQYYPLGQSRMNLNWDAEKPLKEVIQEYTKDEGDERPDEVEYDLHNRSEWKKTLEKINQGDPEWTGFAHKLRKIWMGHKVSDFEKNKTGIEARLNDFRNNQLPFMHPNNVKLKIDVGYKGYRGGTMFHAKYFAAYEQTMRMATAYMGGTDITAAHMMLKKPDADGRVTEANFNRHTGETGLNFVLIDKNAMKSPLHLARYLEDLAKHELTHNFVSGHNQNFTSMEVSVGRKMAGFFPAILDMAEAVTGKTAAEIRAKAGETQIQTVTVVEKEIIEVEKIMKQLIPQAQLDLWNNQQMGVNNGATELFTPGRKKASRQLGLFRDDVVGFNAGFFGEEATSEPGGRAKQPGSRRYEQTGEGRGDTGANQYGRAAEAAEVKKNGFSIVDYMDQANPNFETGGLVNLTDLLEAVQKDWPYFTMNELAPWLDKLAHSGKYDLGAPYLFLVKAINPEQTKFINKQGGIFGRKIALAKIGDTYYQQVGIRQTMKVPNRKVQPQLQKPNIARKIFELNRQDQIGLTHELGVRAIRSPSFRKDLDFAITKLEADAKFLIGEAEGDFAETAIPIYKDALDWSNYYNVGLDNAEADMVDQWATGSMVVRDDVIAKVFGEGAQYAARAAQPVGDMGVSVDDVKRLFKGQSVGIDKDGNVWVQTSGGKGLTIKAVDEISPDQVDFFTGYGRMQGGMMVTGEYRDGVISLHRDLAGRWTLAHETYHWLEDAGFITADEANALSRHIRGLSDFPTVNKNDVGGSEDRANFVAWSLRAREAERKGVVGRILQKIRDLIDGLASFFMQTPRGIVRAVESGKIFDRTTRDAQHFENVTPKVAQYNADMGNIQATAWQKLGRIWKAKKEVREGLAGDTTLLDRLLSLPSHYFGKVPALARIFNDGVKRSDNYYNILTGIEEQEGESGLKKWRQFKKRDKGEYSRVKDYLVKRDREAYGYKVIYTQAGYELRDPDGDRISTFQNQQEAWTAAIEHEGATLANAGYSDMAVDAVKTFRKITHNGFELLKGHMNKIIRRYQEAGKPLPKVAIFVEGEKVMVDLNVALAKMGDVRGYYFPRVRKGGRFTAYANDLNQDETTMRNPELVHFDSEWLAAKYKAEKEAQGYKVEVKHRKKMPEDVYEAAGNIASLSALLNQSLENMSDHKEAMKKVELEFAKALTEQISDLIKMRGVRSHMISRNTATGNKVWTGYEEDPAQALAKYAQGVAAGEAKKIMALDMLRHFTGTDVSWKDFKAQRIAEHLRSIGAAIPEDLEPGALRNTISLELADRGIAAKDIVKYKDYMEFVKARKVDPINQKNAFKDGQTYIDDMLRNDEFIDRFIGNVKGLSVLWYLAGRVSAPVVNMTAMVTSVPAVMKGVAGIPIPKALAMWPRAMNAYRDFSGFGGGRRANLDPWTIRAFEEMERQGWHKAQYNKEALMILKSRIGQGWDSTINFLMLGFGVTEKWNRVSTIMGTYMALKEKNAAAFNEASESGKLKMHNKWMATAKEVSDMAHAVYGKANRPHYGRGSNVAARAIQAFYVFKTFSHNYMLEMIDLGYNKREYQAAAFMAISPAILAGAAASPLLAALFKAFQLGGSDEPEESFYEWVEANLGGGSSELARLGFFGKLGVSLKGSLQINVTDIPTTLKDFAGAPGALFTDMYLGTKSLARGDYSKAVEKMSPKFAGNAFRAWREYHQGLTTNSNAPVFYGKERVKLDLTEAILRGLSFNPARIASIREKQFKEALLADKYSQARNDINARMKAFYLTPKEKRDPDTYVDILNDIRAYNNKVKSKGLPFPYITGQSIQNNIRRSMKPNKQERQRAAEIPLLK